MAYEIDISKLIEGAQPNDAAFSSIMGEVTRHLDDQLTKGRIQPDSYAQVYLGSLSAVMEYSIQFLLNKDQAALQAELIEAQKLQIEAEIERINADKLRIEAEVAKATEELALIQAQVAKIEADTALTNVQKSIADVQLLIANKDLIRADKELLKIDAEIGLMEKQETLTANQAQKVLQEIDAIAQQTILTTNQAAQVLVETNKITAEIQAIDTQREVAQQQKSNMVKEGLLIDKQILKTDAEVGLLEQKRITEQAQTSDSVNGTPVTGYIGKQKSLYDAQIQGFVDDAKAKRAKIGADIYAVMRSTNDQQVPPVTETDLANMILGRE